MTNTQDTTPARTEAQDEGAAGERVDLWYPVKSAIARAMQDERDGKPCGCIIEAGCEANGYHDASYAADGFLDAATDAVTRLIVAHPSPPPAADEDRVLDAAAAYLREQYGASYGLDNAIDRARILAALKSTAAKEGGE